jgi:hypothetical protein
VAVSIGNAPATTGRRVRTRNGISGAAATRSRRHVENEHELHDAQ